MQLLPSLDTPAAIQYPDIYTQFCSVLKTIGASPVEIKNTNEIFEYVNVNFTSNTNYVTTIAGLQGIKMLDQQLDAHFLENIEVAVIAAQFGVAENGSVWLTNEDIKIRALPFICQHLVVVLNKKDLVSNMHQAYKLIGDNNYEVNNL